MRAVSLIFLFVLSPVLADVPDSQKPEVEHLLKFVKESACEMDRNGSRHPGPKAYQHIAQKYDYSRNKIRSTEEFIAYSASKSTTSNHDYLAVCPGQTTVKTQDWLLAELKRFRTKNSAAK